MLTLISHSWRSWKREKGLALLAVVALATGIACTTAIFTVVEAVLLRPLPYTHGERWVALFAGSTSDPNHVSGLSFADLFAFEQGTRSFDVFGWFPVGGDYNLTSPGQPRHIDGIEVSPSLIANTGAHPVAGRFFTTSDGPNVAVISHRLFTQLGRGIVGRLITLSGRSYTVVGAMPAWFRLPLVSVYSRNSDNDVWLPINTPRDQASFRYFGFYTAYARLRPGVTVAQARADAKRVAVRIGKEDHPNDPGFTAALSSLQDTVVKTIRPILVLLLGAAGLLLLITCANVAGLLVSRSVGRARETAIRVALGGGQKQLALQYFFESLLVSFAAVAAGIVASVVLVRLVVSFAADYIPRSDEISTNWPVVLFAIVLAFVTATLSSLAPLWQALRTQPNEVLSDGVRASAGVRSRKVSQGLVIAEIALAFTLISAGALLVWHLNRLSTTWPGFDPDHVLTFQITKSGDRGNVAAMSAYSDKLLGALQAIPGVSGAALTNQLPLAGCCFTSSIFPEGRSYKGDVGKPVSFMVVSAGYFQTLRIPLMAGRLLNNHDTNENLVAAVIDEDAAKRYWPGQGAVGQFARINGPQGSRLQIAGVVGTVQNEGLGEAPMPELYILKQLAAVNPMQFVVRSARPAANLAPAIRRAVAEVDPAQPIYSVRSMREIRGESLMYQRIESVVVTIFAFAALLLASLGVYGLTSYSVRQRVTELGTRMAIGATGRDLLRLVVGSGLRLSVYGLLVGAVAVFGATVLLTRYLKVHELSPIPYVFSVAAVVALALLASFVPGWRASLLSPMVAIRNETDSIWTAARRTLAQVRERVTAEKPGALVDSTLLTEFIEASRRADSFEEALRISLDDLRAKLSAQSALLLEKLSAGEYRRVAASPQSNGDTFKIPETGFLLNRLRFYSAPLSFTPADVETSLRWAREQRPQHVPELELLEATGLRLAVPLRTKHDLIGLLLFGERVGREDYVSSEKILVAACAEQFALTLENARLNERVLEQEKVRRDIALATEVQKRLLPETSPHIDGSSLDAFTLAARSVGGDYYDFFQVGDHRVGIALADIAGKGIAAALIMAVVQASLRILASDGDISLPELAAKMNRFLHQSTGSSSYATFFYAQLDDRKRQLRYVNAGHNPPYLVRSAKRAEGANGSVAPIEELATGGMIIGMFAFASYEESVVDLNPGDVLMAFTDGVTEALNPAEEEFGEERLKQLLRGVAHLPVLDITAAVSTELRTWIADAPQHDDLTFIVLKVNEEQAA